MKKSKTSLGKIFLAVMLLSQSMQGQVLMDDKRTLQQQQSRIATPTETDIVFQARALEIPERSFSGFGDDNSFVGLSVQNTRQISHERYEANYLKDGTCPDGSLYSNPADGDWALTSSTDQGTINYFRFDNTLLDESSYVEGFVLWGLQAYYDGTEWSECLSGTMDFQVIFYEDNGGLPGNVLYGDTITVTPVIDSNVYFGGWNVKKFEITLAESVAFYDGFISIASTNSETCWFLGIDSNYGIANSYTYDEEGNFVQREVQSEGQDPYNTGISICVLGFLDYSVTFIVDMADVVAEKEIDFDPETHSLYVSGTFSDWAVPGSDELFELTPVGVNRTDSIILMEDFSNGIPSDWTLQSSSSVTWHTVENITIDQSGTLLHPVTGSQFAYCPYTYTENQDEKLITPVIDLTNAGSAQLSFSFFGYYEWSVDPYDFCDLFVQVSVNDGDWIQIWEETDHPQYNSPSINYVWLPTVVDLSPFVGLTIRLRFHYVGNDGAPFGIDDVVITAENGDNTQPLLYSLIADLPAGEHLYKYYLAEDEPTWENPEWPEDIYRTILITEESIVRDTWGQINEAQEHHTVTFIVTDVNDSPVENAMIQVYHQNPADKSNELSKKTILSNSLIAEKPKENVVLYSDSEGQASIEAQPGNYFFMVEKEQYQNFEDSLVVTDTDLTIDVSLQTDYSVFFAGGSGTEQDPWLIETAEHLDNIRLFLGDQNDDKYFLQIADIDLGVYPWNWGLGWIPIGNDNNRFTSNYDGSGFGISNLVVNNPELYGAGLFGRVNNALIKNVRITEASVNAKGIVGVIAGNIANSVIADSYATGSLYASGFAAGGLVGINLSSLITRCMAAVEVESELFSTGGICGEMSFGVIENSYATGNVTSINTTGGLVGSLKNSSELINSYAVGFVSTPNNGGGLIGYNDHSISITNSYRNIEITGPEDSGGEGKTTLEMLSEATFNSWDFDTIWSIVEGETYPFLQWQETPEDFNYPVTILMPYDFLAIPGDESILLHWQTPSYGVPTGFNIYRNGEHVDTLDAETLQYTDTGLENFQDYSYSLTAIYNDNQESDSLHLKIFPTPGFSDGDGSEENPFLVSNAGELHTVRLHLSAHFRQVADIDLDVAPWNLNQGWKPLSSIVDPFQGYYDGNGYAIYGATINRPLYYFQGLFGYVSNATIVNLNIQNSNVAGLEFVGILAGGISDSQISNVAILGGSVLSTRKAGGLAGIVENNSSLSHISCDINVHSSNIHAGGIAAIMENGSTLINSMSSGTVSALLTAGGLIGELKQNATIDMSYSSANVNVIYSDAGGLVGSLSQSYLGNSYATGTITGGDRVAGLIGLVVVHMQGYHTIIEDNYSVGSLDSSGTIGGLVAGVFGDDPHYGLFDFQNNYWDIQSSGQEESALGEGLNTAEMLVLANFENWDFAETWSNIETVTYPFLQWQGEPEIHNYPLIDHQVTFRLNMETAEDFNPENDVVYITGNMFEWAVPGSDSGNQTMTRVDDSMIWEKTLTIPTGVHQYKYFLNDGWDGGEWMDAPDRQVTIIGDTIIENTWGVPEGGTSINRVETVSAQLFPNPANDYLYIHASSAINRIRIVDITGRIIFNQHYNHSAVQIPVDSFEAGLYVVQIYTLEGLMTRKLMVD